MNQCLCLSTTQQWRLTIRTTQIWNVVLPPSSSSRLQSKHLLIVPEENETYLLSGLMHKYIHTIGWKRITIYTIKHWDLFFKKREKKERLQNSFHGKERHKRTGTHVRKAAAGGEPFSILRFPLPNMCNPPLISLAELTARAQQRARVRMHLCASVIKMFWTPILHNIHDVSVQIVLPTRCRPFVRKWLILSRKWLIKRVANV